MKEKTEKKAPRARTADTRKKDETKALLGEDKAEKKTFAPKRAAPVKEEPKEEKKEPAAAQKGGVYIGNLSYSVTDKAFGDFVYGFGKIKEQFIQRDKRGRSKGYGIVIFRYA